MTTRTLIDPTYPTEQIAVDITNDSDPRWNGGRMRMKDGGATISQDGEVVAELAGVVPVGLTVKIVRTGRYWTLDLQSFVQAVIEADARTP